MSCSTQVSDRATKSFERSQPETTSTDHPKRVCNSLQTLCALFYALFKRHATEMNFDVISTMFDFNEIEDKMRTLITKCNNLMVSDVSEPARLMCLKLLLVLVTGSNNVSQNILLEYIMLHSQMFESFVRLLSDPTLRGLYGHDVVILLTLLVNYRKYETTNPFIVQLSILADELALNGFAWLGIDFLTAFIENLFAATVK